MATHSVKDIAAKWDTTPRTLRKFLRRDAVAQGGTVGEDTPGKGGRYAIEGKSLNALKRRFDAWAAENAAKDEEGEEATESDIDADAPDAPESD